MQRYETLYIILNKTLDFEWQHVLLEFKNDSCIFHFSTPGELGDSNVFINICNAHKTTPKKYFLYRSCKAIQMLHLLQDNIFSNSNILIYATSTNQNMQIQNKSESDGNFLQAASSVFTRKKNYSILYQNGKVL